MSTPDWGDRFEELDPEEAARRLAELLYSSHEIKSLSMAFLPDIEGPLPIVRCAGLDLSEFRAVSGQEIDMGTTWTVQMGEGTGTIFLDIDWPEINQTLRLHVGLDDPCRSIMLMLAMSGGHLGIMSTEGEQGSTTLLHLILDIDDDIFKVAMAAAHVMAERDIEASEEGLNGGSA